MASNDPEKRIAELEERVKYLEMFVFQSLLFRVEDLSNVVMTAVEPNEWNKEVNDHIRHLTDQARLGGWTDDGP